MGGKASGPGNEAGNKESETAPIIPEEVCPTTTVEAIFRVASPKAFSCERWLRHPEGRDLAAPKIIEELIDKFESDPDFYRSTHFNETEVRTQFINPFFDALGWDVYHKCIPDNRDVKEEDAVKVEGKTKNPDYSFRAEKAMHRGDYRLRGSSSIPGSHYLSLHNSHYQEQNPYKL